MSHPSPLESHWEQMEAAFIPYGESVRLVGELARVELEYAAIRKAAALLDAPHRGLVRLTGRDRLDFLHRMLSNDCRSLNPGDVQRNFLLNSKGRIMADMLVVEQQDATLIDLDVYTAATVAAELDKMLFGEDVQVMNLSDSHHGVIVNGPKAERVAHWWTEASRDNAAIPHDETGEGGYHLWGPAASASKFADQAADLRDTFDLRPIGWLAFNIARIEAGRPMFNIDFGPDSLPHETGVLDEAVSFTKGCYRGQEIVARMQSLGHPAKLLVGFRVEGDAVPVAGAPVLDGTASDAATVGAVTSSTFAPMLSQAPIGFAMVKWAKREIGTRLYVPAEGHNVPVTVAGLSFYTPPKRAAEDSGG